MNRRRQMFVSLRPVKSYLGNMEISVVTPEDLDALVHLASDFWGRFYNGFDEAFVQVVSECLVRDALTDEDLALKVTQDGEVKGMLLATRKGHVARLDEWAAARSATMTAEEKKWFDLLLGYMKEADDKTFALMDEDDVKLSLFVSAQKGGGKLLLEGLARIFREKRMKRMFLWTDDSCTHQYYPAHGFQLAASYADPRYSMLEEPYYTYIYWKGTGLLSDERANVE